MPEMDLDPPDELLPDNYVMARLWSYMLFPNDDAADAEARSQYMAGHVVRLLGAFENRPYTAHADDMDEDTFRAVHEHIEDRLVWRYLKPLGGYAALQGRGTAELSDRVIEELRTVGFIARAIYSMDKHHKDDLRGGASLAKAMEIADEANASYGFLGNLTYIKAAWRKYSPVAHLCATLDTLLEYYAEAKEEDVRPFLGMSYHYQEFLRTFRPQPESSSSLLISFEKLWRVPEWCGELKVTLDSFPLPDDLLQIARKHRARK